MFARRGSSVSCFLFGLAAASPIEEDLIKLSVICLDSGKAYLRGLETLLDCLGICREFLHDLGLGDSLRQPPLDQRPEVLPGLLVIA